MIPADFSNNFSQFFFFLIYHNIIDFINQIIFKFSTSGKEAFVIKLNCSTFWVEAKIIETVKLLQSNKLPKPSSTCEYCNYLKKRWLLQKNN